jgi:biotin-(acetyl-CoA carboxylase) ligase
MLGYPLRPGSIGDVAHRIGDVGGTIESVAAVAVAGEQPRTARQFHGSGRCGQHWSSPQRRQALTSPSSRPVYADEPSAWSFSTSIPP